LLCLAGRHREEMGIKETEFVNEAGERRRIIALFIGV
jgi:hypothetical protein